MALALTIVISSVLLLLSLLGYLRDLRRGLLALLGTLGGAIMVNFWGDQWGAGLASRFVNADPKRVTFYVSSAIFVWSALVVGYGGGILLNRAKERPFPQRLAGALLGLINGALLVGFLLRFATKDQPGFVPIIQANPLAKIIHDGLPWLFLGLAVLVTFVVVVRAVLGLFSRPAVPPQKPTDTKPAPAPLHPPPSQPTSALASQIS